MEIVKETQAGTLESSDVCIALAPNAGQGIEIDLTSVVKAQFGEAIEKTIRQVLEEMEVRDARVTIQDRGALDCVIRARMRCVICRGAEKSYDWSREDGTWQRN